MSGTVTDSLNLNALIAQIERNQAETRKFAEEAAKFAVEQRKLTEEAAKFGAEARKLTWDARLLPWFQGVTMLGAVITAGVALWKAFHG